MKRKIFLIIVAILCASLSLCALCACNRENNASNNDNICRQTNAYYIGESDAFFVSIEFGKREKTFIADGKATDVCDFVEIAITPLKKIDSAEISYQIVGENSTLNGAIGASDYGEYIDTIALDFQPLSIAISAGDVASNIDFCNILEGALSSSDVINIARIEFKDRLEREESEGKAQREVYVKLISGDRTNFYYYVSFIGEGVDYWAVLIDIKTGEIVSKK